MLSSVALWLAGAGIIGLMSLFAHSNRRRGWRRQRTGAGLLTLRELMELDAEVRESVAQAASTPILALAPPQRAQPASRPDDPASLAALARALEHASPSPGGHPLPPPAQPADARNVAP